MNAARHSAFIGIIGWSVVLWAAPSPRVSAADPTFAPGARLVHINSAEMKEWLTYISSDQLQGRQIFTEGYGLAAAYVADHLRQRGVKPFGDDGTYFQTVKLRGYRGTRRSWVTIEVNGQTRTFRDGEHVTFSVNAGGLQTVTFNGVEFVGAGLGVPASRRDDYAGHAVRGKLVVWMSGDSPVDVRVLNARGQYAIDTMGAGASLGYRMPPTPAERALAEAQAALVQANQAVAQAQQAVNREQRPGGGQAGAGGGGPGGRDNQTVQPDFLTVERVDHLIPPRLIGDDDFLALLLSAAPMTFAELKARADKHEGLPDFSLPSVKVTIHIDNLYDLVSTQLSRNVVGVVDGADAALKNRYVLFGAHLDHLGYLTAPRTDAGGGRSNDAATDLIYNGADDDGSGTVAELAIAKAFATGPKPKRSIVFIWHTGEEAGLYGSQYNADFPVVPLDNVQCQLNMDMIGRNANNDSRNANQVYVVGADRISTDLHNVIVDVNGRQRQPLSLDYAWNDPADPQRIYFRSDHYSYASKGVPIAFFTTGLHPDYHQVSDAVDKILFDKMARITQLIYEVGFTAANTERALARDNQGPRTGKGFTGRIRKSALFSEKLQVH